MIFYSARVVLRLYKFSHTTPALATLHWLPINHRIDFKIALLVYKALNGQAPAYIADLLQPYDPPWKLTSNSFHNHTCYVAICDRRILWRCRNLWLKVSQFVTGVAICDGKCRNLWQRQNMQFSDIYSPNFDKYFVLSSYLYLCETYFSRLSLNFVSSIIVFIHELFGHSNSLLVAHNSKSHNDVRC